MNKLKKDIENLLESLSPHNTQDLNVRPYLVSQIREHLESLRAELEDLERGKNSNIDTVRL